VISKYVYMRVRHQYLRAEEKCSRDIENPPQNSLVRYVQHD
jgi:hypothetical protein